MMGAIFNFILSRYIATAMRGFLCANEVPLCEPLLHSHQMTVIAEHVLSFFALHFSLKGKRDKILPDSGGIDHHRTQ
jgi:hypothetical protein